MSEDYFRIIPERIKRQMLVDIANGVDSWEVRGKVAQALIQGCYVDSELQAHNRASQWYEAMTYTDLSAIACNRR